MTTFEKCQAVRRIIVNRAAEVMNYNWGDEFSSKQIRGISKDFEERIGEINIAELTASQMDDLEFGQWSKEDPMRLIPLWLYQFLPDEIESKPINGEKSILKKSEMDTDNRFGYLAYGIWPNNSND